MEEWERAIVESLRAEVEQAIQDSNKIRELKNYWNSVMTVNGFINCKITVKKKG